MFVISMLSLGIAFFVPVFWAHLTARICFSCKKFLAGEKFGEESIPKDKYDYERDAERGVFPENQTHYKYVSVFRCKFCGSSWIPAKESFFSLRFLAEVVGFLLTWFFCLFAMYQFFAYLSGSGPILVFSSVVSFVFALAYYMLLVSLGTGSM